MKNINYKLLLVASTLLLLPQLVQAQNVESCNPTDCKTLGYSRNSTNYCAKYLACPFDGSYKICLNQCSDKYIAAAEKISPIVAEKSTPKKTSAEIAANTQLSLTGNLGFSTQGVTELIALLQTEFGQEAPNPSDIKTVDDLIVTFGSDCADYPLTSCPSGATCESQYIITSCQSGYKLVTTILGTKCTKTTTETTCSAGQYNNNGTCTDCPAGSYSSLAGATACTKCAVGTYQDKTGQTSCKTCPTATVVGERICVSSGDTCPALTSCPDGATCSRSGSKYTITSCDVGFTETLGGATTGLAIKKCIISCEPNCSTTSDEAKKNFGCNTVMEYSYRCFMCCDKKSATVINTSTTHHGIYGRSLCAYEGLSD